ncbi:Prolyl 4-hydroxylase alpha subunit [Penicillium cf. griseofulvum]|nr:Prolyl 4-hydroxylase alpha subunit [Penicillium cf. griseofulvum]
MPKSTEATIFGQMRQEYEAQCPVQKYQTLIFSTDPLIIYIEDYLSYEETRYLLHLADPLFIQSPVSKGYRLDEYDLSIRSSKSAVLPSDPVVACIEQRTMDFQGYHFDLILTGSRGWKTPRVSTIFAYLECDDCVGGSTQFPYYRGSFPASWCKFIDCEDNEDNRAAGGIGFKPIQGNAVFWRNLYENGTGHPGVWHAGMPVHKGRKSGLNIFTRKETAYSENTGSFENSDA